MIKWNMGVEVIAVAAIPECTYLLDRLEKLCLYNIKFGSLRFGTHLSLECVRSGILLLRKHPFPNKETKSWLVSVPFTSTAEYNLSFCISYSSEQNETRSLGLMLFSPQLSINLSV